MLVSRIINIYKLKGLSGMISFFLSKIYHRLFFDRVAFEVKNHLSQRTNPEVYRRLSEGVYYVYGMGVVGDIAEFGTMSGRTAVALAASLNYCNLELSDSDKRHGFDARRKLWLFDSFEGLPIARTKIDQTSLHVSSGIWGRGSCLGLSPESLLKLISKYLRRDSIEIVKGWFKDTVPELPAGLKFALLHIDGDLYESAIDVLDVLFSRNMVSKGAIVFFDDWNCNAANPDFGERRAWHEMVIKFRIRFSDLGAYGTASQRFIIHDYASL